MRQFTPRPRLGTQARIGLISLSSDPSAEAEWRSMLPDEDIAMFVSRIPYASNCTPEHLKAMGPEMTKAASLLEPELDIGAICYGCTSGTVSIGYDAVEKGIRDAHPGMPVVTPISAAVSACRQMQLHNISIVTPYSDLINEGIAQYLKDADINIIGMTGFGLTNDNDIGSIPLDALIEAAQDVITNQSEGIFFSCTGLNMVKDIAGLEGLFDIPVITSNQAMLWETLRKANYAKAINGYGKLMLL